MPGWRKGKENDDGGRTIVPIGSFRHQSQFYPKRLERGMLFIKSVKTRSENHGRVRRRKNPDYVNSKLIMAAVRLWELKRRNPAR
jgi:hypothetical protein